MKSTFQGELIHKLFSVPAGEIHRFYIADYLITIDKWKNRLHGRYYFMAYICPRGSYIGADDWYGFKIVTKCNNMELIGKSALRRYYNIMSK